MKLLIADESHISELVKIGIESHKEYSEFEIRKRIDSKTDFINICYRYIRK